jgi:hypothetical protein
MPDHQHPKPVLPGYYWAIWRSADAGTRFADVLTAPGGWEVVWVIDNGLERERYRVLLPGVEESQSVENFTWGPGPLHRPD